MAVQRFYGTASDYEYVVKVFDPKVRRVDVYAAFPRIGEVTLAVRWWPWVLRQRRRLAALQLLIQPRDADGQPDAAMSLAPIGTVVHVERA